MAQGRPKEPKRHHYVSSGYLKAFTHQGDSVFYFDKDRPEKGIQLRNRKKILRIKDLYSDYTATTEREAVTERIIAAEIDDKIPSFVISIETAARQGMTYEEYLRLREFSEAILLNFFYRSPYIRSKAIKHPLYKASSVFSWLSLALKHNRKPTPEELLRAQNNRLQSFIANAHRQDQNPLNNLSCCFVSPYPNENFITGSNPVYVQFPKFFSTKNYQRKRQRFYFMPLTPVSGLLFTDQPIENILFSLQKGEAEGLNRIVAGQSTKIISHDREVMSQYL